MNTTNINQNQNQLEIGYAVNLEKLKELREQGLTYRELAQYFGVHPHTIEYWLREVLHITTVRGQFKPKHKPKVEVPIYNNSDLYNVFHIDISFLTIKRDSKHKRATLLAMFTLEFKDCKLAYILPKSAIHKLVIGNILLELKNKYNINIVLGDKQFAFLRELGFEVYKRASWNCSKQVNEKHYGNLKRWIYPLFEHIKRVFKLNDKDLLENPELIKPIYIQELAKRGFRVIDLTIGNNLLQYASAISITN